jgi:hypothetical protein
LSVVSRLGFLIGPTLALAVLLFAALVATFGSWRGALLTLAIGGMVLISERFATTLQTPYCCGLLASIVSSAAAVVILPMWAERRAAAVVAEAGVADVRGLSAGGDAAIGVAGLIAGLALLHLAALRFSPYWANAVALLPIVIIALGYRLLPEVTAILDAAGETSLGIVMTSTTIAVVGVTHVPPSLIGNNIAAVCIVVTRSGLCIAVAWGWLIVVLLPIAAAGRRLKKEAEARAEYEKRHRAPLDEILKGVIR